MNTSTTADDLAAHQIEQLRTRLLDLRSSNPLIAFKHSDRARTHVRVIDAAPDILFNQLIEGRSLTFVALPPLEDEPADERSDAFVTALREAKLSDEAYLAALEALGDDPPEAKLAEAERALRDRLRKTLGLPERPKKERPTLSDWARENGIDPSYDLSARHRQALVPTERLNAEIQTLLLPEAFERKLGGLLTYARTSLQELGINTLYCVFGFLEWYESDASDRPILSPLLLHSVELQRTLQGSTYRFSISSMGEETVVNVTLNERLGRDFNLLLPPLEGDEGPEAYFETVTKIIRDKPRWRVRRFVTVGRFSFARLAMYHDLDPSKWPSHRPLTAHPAVRELLTGTDRDAPFFSEVYDTDAPAISRQVPLLITDADASQFSAVVDVMRGTNLAIEGPPGTGKSQTITNIIAAALAKGQRVLFVAEKIAALEVVKKRLDDAGLGEFCLELHSTKAKKPRCSTRSVNGWICSTASPLPPSSTKPWRS